MKRNTGHLALGFWVAAACLLIQLGKRPPCPGEHHEPRISMHLAPQNP
jgi:hypothetical protein